MLNRESADMTFIAVNLAFNSILAALSHAGCRSNADDAALGVLLRGSIVYLFFVSMYQ